MLYETSASELGELLKKLEDLFKVICEIKVSIWKALVLLIRTKDDSTKYVEFTVLKRRKIYAKLSGCML